MAVLPATNLSPMQRAFCEHYAEGNQSREACALAAGLAPSGAKAWAQKTLRKPNVLAFLAHIADTTIRSRVANATKVLIDLMNDPSTSPAERRKIASEVLDRCDLVVEKISKLQVRVTHVHEETREQMIWDIGRAAIRRGKDPGDPDYLGNALQFVPAGFLQGPRPLSPVTVDYEPEEDDSAADESEFSMVPGIPRA